MNTEMINLLLTPSKCHLSSLNEDMGAALSLLKNLWRDQKTLLTINKAKILFDQSLQIDCMGGCQKCNRTILAILNHLNSIGLDQVFLNLLLARQNLKKKS